MGGIGLEGWGGVGDGKKGAGVCAYVCIGTRVVVWGGVFVCVFILLVPWYTLFLGIHSLTPWPFPHDLLPPTTSGRHGLIHCRVWGSDGIRYSRAKKRSLLFGAAGGSFVCASARYVSASRVGGREGGGDMCAKSGVFEHSLRQLRPLPNL